jgi:hypothetical protein
MNGLWTAEFGSSAGIFGGGVAVFRDGQIFGGDSSYYYIGSYALQGNTLAGSVVSFPFLEGARSIFNTVGRPITLDFRGSLTSDGLAVAQGTWREMPGHTFGLKLTKRR